MKPLRWLFVLAALLATALLLVATSASADNGNASPTLSFFSGGDGANAHWVNTADQPPGDTDNQAIQLQTTNDALTFSKGYAGILVHHVTGIPAAAFPDSEFWVKATNYSGASLGSPRLVVEFQDTAGNFVGDGQLRPLTLTSTRQDVNDQAAYPNSGWDVSGGTCGFLYNVKWQDVQSCFAGDTVLSVFIVADAYGINHLIDDITVDGKRFSNASDNGGGNNTQAGPAATTDPSLLPPNLLALL
ncbi:MAG TPA: hypothetical protein VE984_06705 [Gaiellaceae bacterium]|nr:hypothetical protein [Gaiellaceae bacterium]